MTTPQKFRRLFAKSIDDIHITYFCPYCRKDHRHGSCNNFLDSRIENRSTHGDKCRGNIDIMICKDTTRKGLDSQQRLEMRVKRKQLEEAYTAYNIPSVKFEFNQDYSKTQLPSAPDLSILESIAYDPTPIREIPELPAKIPLINIPSRKVDDYDTVELVDLPSRIIEE